MTETNKMIKHWVIYKIESPSGRVYVGRTCNYIKRKYTYFYNTNKSQLLISKSLKKYGFDKHKFSVLEKFEGDINCVDDKEMFWIRSYMSNICRFPDQKGLNATDGGGGAVGYKHSEETRRKSSERNKKNPSRGMLGKKMSTESKLKQSIAKKGKPPPNKGKKGQRAWNKGLKGIVPWNKGTDYSFWSEEERRIKFGSQNVGNSYNKGRKHSTEIIEARRARQTGKPVPAKWKPILQYSTEGKLIAEYPSVQQSEVETKISKTSIRNVAQGKVAAVKGFVFKYK